MFQTKFERRYEDGNPFNRKFCACMSLRGGCALACTIWLGVNIYFAAVAFLGYTPIFSYLNRPALIVLGSLSIVFALVSFLILYGLFVDTPLTLEAGVFFLFLIVPIYLLDILANIFVFGIQKSLYMDWCLNRSKESSTEDILFITKGYSEALQVDPTDYTSLDTYNCQKLWEDEIKFSIAIFITMAICYIYWALCVLHYHRKLRDLFPQRAIPTGFMTYAPRFLPGYFYNNYPPTQV